MRILKYTTVFLLGFLIAKFWFEKKSNQSTKEETQVVLNQINNLSKLVVSEGSFSEVINYSDTKKYFYDFFQFDKKAIVTINAKVEVGYDLSKMEVQVDSINKQLSINSIPEETVVISPDIKYFDLQQSQFNSFSKEELNTINKKGIERIKETIELSKLKAEAKQRLFEELSKLYQLSKVYGWSVKDNTNRNLFSKFKD